MFNPGDLVTADFPGVTGIKRRPAVVVSTARLSLSSARCDPGVITTQTLSATTSMDYLLQDWTAAGLHRAVCVPIFLRHIASHCCQAHWSLLRARLESNPDMLDSGDCHSVRIYHGSNNPRNKTIYPLVPTLGAPAVLPGAILAALMLWSVTRSIGISNWAEGLEVLTSVALPALLVGIIFARLRWLPGWLAHLLSAALGVAWSIQQIGPLLVREVGQELGMPMGERLVTWGDRASEILIRSTMWARILAGRRARRGYRAVRGGAGAADVGARLRDRLAAVPLRLGLVGGGAECADNPDQLYLRLSQAEYAVLCVPGHRAVAGGASEYCAPPGALALGSSRVPRVYALALLVRGGAVLQPDRAGDQPAARQRQQRPGRARVAHDQLAADGGARGLGEGVQHDQRAARLSRRRLCHRGVRAGGPRSLGDGMVLRIRSSKFDYWRAVAMDKYTGHAWQSTVGERARSALGLATEVEARSPVEAGISIPQADLAGRTLVTQTVELVSQSSDKLLIFGGQFSSANLPVLIQSGVRASQRRQAAAELRRDLGGVRGDADPADRHIHRLDLYLDSR